MVNLEKLSLFLNRDVMPLNAIVELEIKHELISESLETKSFFTDCLIEKIKKISVGKTVENQIEKIVDFKSKESIVSYFSKQIQILNTERLDVHSDVVIIKFSTEIFYANKNQIDKETIGDIQKIKFKSFFMEVEI